MDTRLVPRITIQLKSSINIENKPDQNIRLTEGSHFDAAAFDISSHGLGLIMKYFLPKGTSIEIVIEGAPFGLKEDMKIKGEIKYCNSIAGHQHKCGVEFISLPEECQKAIDAFIAKNDRRQNPRLNLPAKPD